MYFGAFRNEILANGERFTTGVQSFSSPSEINTNYLYLAGAWNIQKEYAENTKTGDRIIFKFIAKQVNIVAESNEPVETRVLLDGKEIDRKIIQDSQLYNLVELSEQGEHLLEIIIENPGLKAYAFTFG